MGVSSQPVHVVALTLCLGSKLFNQRWHERDDVGDQLLYRLVRINAAVEDAVEQVFNRPGQLADDQRTHHATATLEGVEGSPDFA